jgi:hypothetical protein
MYFSRRSKGNAWYLHHIHRSTGKPRSLELSQEGLFSYEAPDSRREPKHFVEADRHRIGRRSSEGYF